MGYRTWIDYIATSGDAPREGVMHGPGREAILVDAVAEVYEKSTAQVESAVRRARKAADQRAAIARPLGASEPSQPYEVTWADGEAQPPKRLEHCIRTCTSRACHDKCLPEVGMGAPCRIAPTYEARVRALEAQGLSTSDAQAAADAEGGPSHA